VIREAIAKLVERLDLSEDEAAAVMEEVVSGEATPAQFGAFVTALRMKGESVSEIAGLARIMHRHALHVEVEGPLLDTCGTGGDASGTFNVSTAAGFVCAGAGVRVAKHGNRAASSESGSADVLEALGCRIELTPQQVKECIERTGFGFMFAQAFHPAMRLAGGLRREVGIRTVFNVLGPLTNPAGARHQLLGVPSAELGAKMAEALGRLGAVRALVVAGEGGLDEVSISGATEVFDLHDGRVRRYSFSPNDAGLRAADPSLVKGGSPAENAERIRRILAGEPGPGRDFVLINAGAALIAAGRAAGLREGVGLASVAIDSGAARRAMEAFVELTRSFG
jgi:anthranilate phosphoribosyltransferase